MEFQRNDAILNEILKEKNTIIGFLESVFGFLSRNTDFYHVMKNNSDTIGFPSGYKEKLVSMALGKFEQKITFDIKSPKTISSDTQISNDIEVASIETVETENVITEIPLKKPNSNNEKFQLNEYYNGAIYDKYCWSQSITDIEVHILIPDFIKSSKQLVIKIETDSIKISEKINNEIILDGKLIKKCKCKDAVWSLSGEKLQITLDKIQETWWNKFLENEPDIDLTKMDCSRDINELPNETQAVIEKLKWDQQQKMLGLPTSEEIKNQEILKKAWDLEGSPFKGQPFDPSTIKFN